MTEDIKKWWNDNAKEYQEESNIAIDVYYGPGSPNEDELSLIGDVKGKNVLEIGCGAAHCGIAFAKKGANVIGIDISEEQLKMAKKLIEKNDVEMKLYEGDITNLNQIESESQDIVFTAWALQYIEDMRTCFKEVYRVLRKEGIFVLSLDHPFWIRVGKESLKLKKSYFETGRYEEQHKKGIFVAYDKTISEVVNALADEEFIIEKMLEPDSRKKNVGDYWYDNQAEHRKEAMKWIPRTMIFKVRK